MPSRRHVQVGIFLAVATATQLLAVAAGKGFLLTQLTMAAYSTLAVIGLSLLMGYAGQISLGHAGFFAIGGYTSAVLTTLDLGPHRAHAVIEALARVGVLTVRTQLFGGEVLVVHPWVACLCAVALAAALAFALGMPVLRLKGHYLAMATLGVGSIVFSIALGTSWLGAADGIAGVPPFPLVPGVAVGGSSAGRVANYHVAFGLLALAMLLLLNLVQSRIGRALRAIHGAEDAADAMGVDTAALKLRTFVLSAVLAAVAGVFLTHLNAGIGPSEASIMKSVKYVAIVAVGGMGSLWGTLATSLALNFLSLRGYFGTFDDAVFGLVLVGVMLFAPSGALALRPRRALRGAPRVQAGPEPSVDEGSALEPAVGIAGAQPGEEAR
ncbi:MAG TPA: branched-chain amino acid ABC transporter permease [Anaeromyxobacteraceae bacterium]|nr:branched-chain amino acid ABC transporter permease [Anaeromyxobacteraceae bacterium]